MQAQEPLPDHIAKELAVKRSTVTPWWWGLKTMVKYRTTRNYLDSAFLATRIGDKIFTTLLILTLYVLNNSCFQYTHEMLAQGCLSAVREGPLPLTLWAIHPRYLNVGRDWSYDNLINIAAIKFMLVLVPAYSAVGYVPTLVLGACPRRTFK
jgi:ATP-binding cassette, subfamily G (WHITE), member 2